MTTKEFLNGFTKLPVVSGEYVYYINLDIKSYDEKLCITDNILNNGLTLRRITNCYGSKPNGELTRVLVDEELRDIIPPEVEGEVEKVVPYMKTRLSITFHYENVDDNLREEIHIRGGLISSKFELHQGVAIMEKIYIYDDHFTIYDELIEGNIKRIDIDKEK